MSPNIPKRWLDYTNIGTQIENTRLIPLKVPLSEKVNDNIVEKDRFGIPEVLEGIPTLGLLIDLTNTDRFYNSKEFVDRGIEYVKIYTEGKVVPSKQCYRIIARAINRFLAKNASNDRLIGVHCTHGINRTGYLICAYLILNNNWSVTDAITNFEKARNHKIERENYISALKNLKKHTTFSSNYQQHERRRTDVVEDNWSMRNSIRNKFVSNYHRRQNNEEDNWRIRSNPNPIPNPNQNNWRIRSNPYPIPKPNQNTNNPYSWRRQN